VSARGVVLIAGIAVSAVVLAVSGGQIFLLPLLILFFPLGWFMLGRRR